MKRAILDYIFVSMRNTRENEKVCEKMELEGKIILMSDFFKFIHVRFFKMSMEKCI